MKEVVILISNKQAKYMFFLQLAKYLLNQACNLAYLIFGLCSSADTSRNQQVTLLISEVHSSVNIIL